MVNRPPLHRRRLACEDRAPRSNGITKRTDLPTLQRPRKWKSTTTHHAPGFWKLLRISGISIGLTKRALQELDRRNITEAVTNPKPRASAPECLPSDIKRFSRHADYSDLRGVNPARLFFVKVLKTRQYPESASTEMASSQSLSSVSNKQRKKSEISSSPGS